MKRYLYTLLLLCGILHTTWAQTPPNIPQNGKIYRITNVKYPDLAMSENFETGKIIANPIQRTKDKGLEQLWIFNAKENSFTIENAFTGRYVQHQTNVSNAFLTGEEPTLLSVDTRNKHYYIKNTPNDSRGMHCDAYGDIVLWDNSATATQWLLEEVSVSEEALSLERATFQEFKKLKENRTHYNEILPQFFEDATCENLKPSYTTMSDEALRSAMQELPLYIQEMAIKIKNNQWGKREKEFRMATYKAYSDPDYWAKELYTKRYNRLNNPTGIYGNAGDILLVFVGNDIPQQAQLYAEMVSGNTVFGEKTPLYKGMNVIAASKDEAMLFIQYIGTTRVDSAALITDYPPLNIHIERGIVNGYWDKSRHNDADWVDISQHLATAKMMQIKGEKVMFHMSRPHLIADNCCKNTITDAIGWWDNLIRWEQGIMGLEDYLPSKFNNLACATSLDNGYQSSTHYRTCFHQDYIQHLLPYEHMMSSADNCWGPAHEHGHGNQAAIQSVGTAEVSNNLFSNLVVNKLGKYTSRGENNRVIYDEYAQHIPFVQRNMGSTMRLYWQLYLYFHEAGFDTQFYPKVFKAMRANPMLARSEERSRVYGNEDLLLFAKACCDAAQMDLSEFFQLWGYFVETDGLYVSDYADYYLTNRKSDIEEFVKHASQYPKAPAIALIEDRIRPIARTDGKEGNKLVNDIFGAEAGEVGHYTDFIDKGVKAEGYTYGKAGRTLVITEGKGAVGFKIYTRVGHHLLYATNRLRCTLPTSVAAQDIIVVAAQADGTDVALPTIDQSGNTPLIRELLQETITECKKITAMADATGQRVGFYYASSVSKLQTLTMQAEEAYTTNDEGLHSFAEWTRLLDTEMSKIVKDPDATCKIHEANTYSLRNALYPSYYITQKGSQLQCLTSRPATNEAAQWTFEPAERDNLYYIRNKQSKKYLSYIAQSKVARAEADSKSKAIAFTVTHMGKGRYAVTDTTQSYSSLHCDSYHQVVGWADDIAQSQWQITCVEDLTTPAQKEQLQKLIAQAHTIERDLFVLPVDSSTDLQSDVIALVPADSLLKAAIALRSYTALLEDNWELMDNPARHVRELTEQITYITKSYKKPMAAPIMSTNDTLVLYTLSVKGKDVCCLPDERKYSSKKGCVTTDDYLSNINNEGIYWYFTAGSCEGEVYIHNLKTRQCIATIENKLYITCTSNRQTPMLLTPVIEEEGYQIHTTQHKAWDLSTSGHILLKDESKVLWEIKKVKTVIPDISSVSDIIENQPVPDDQYYTLQGVSVTPTQPGLYIHNGKKVIIR